MLPPPPLAALVMLVMVVVVAVVAVVVEGPKLAPVVSEDSEGMVAEEEMEEDAAENVRTLAEGASAGFGSLAAPSSTASAACSSSSTSGATALVAAPTIPG